MRIVDCDSHFIPPSVFDNVSEKYKELVPKYKFDDEDRITEITFPVDPVKINYNKSKYTMYCRWAGMSNIKERIKYLNEYGIDKQFLGPQEYAMRFNTSVDESLAMEMAHSFNIEIKKIVDLYPEKFFTAALVPIQNIDLALREVDWAIENNLKAIYIDIKIISSIDKLSHPLSKIKNIHLLFDKCEKNNICIYLHTSMDHPPISNDYISYYQKNYGEDSITSKELKVYKKLMIYDLITEGLLDNFPNLKLIFSEFSAKKIVDSYKNLQKNYSINQNIFKSKKSPLYYFKNNIYITVDIEETELVEYMVNEFGSDRLLFSTDYPHDDKSGSNKFNDVQDLKKSTLPINDLENMAYKNAEKLFSV